jgi:quercetin dioxygenase-like cupin family protein
MNPTRRRDGWLAAVLLFLCAPWGLYKLWRMRAGYWLIVPSALISLPVFLVLYAFAGTVAFAAFLPALDLSVGENLDRTVRYKEGRYESTFLEDARDTNGAYELIQVRVQPGGGNGDHYHRNFEETFTCLEGELTVNAGAERVVLKPGESVTAPPGVIHAFHNRSQAETLMTVRVTPARGLEKSVRVAYGLDGTGMLARGTRMQNVWRYALMLGYSETYLPDIPPMVQEPLVKSLAKIAQWSGKDEELKVFFE